MRLPVIPRLLLDTKADIPYPPAQITIYQPSIKEIAYIGETNFLVGVNALCKNYLKLQDNLGLSQLTNFEILMSIIREKEEQNKKIAEAVFQVLFLIFPHYKVGVTPAAIILQEEEQKQTHLIDKNNFDGFADILYDMFCMIEAEGGHTEDYNPIGDRARALVEKFKKKHAYLAELNKERGQDSSLATVYGRYLNILAIGERKDKNELKEYSVYQLIEEFKRFQLKETFDYTFRAKLAGATKLKDAKDWMGDIHFGSQNDDNNE